MSKSTIRGRIQNFSPKVDEDYYGILVDTGRNEVWFNGDGDVPKDFNKGDQIKLEVNDNKSVGIESWDLPDKDVSKNDVKTEASKDEETRSDSSAKKDDQSRGRGWGSNEAKSQSTDVSRQERIKVQCAFKKAVDQVDRRSTESESDYRKMVKDLTIIHVEVLDEVMSQ